jgi:hypothetical protein
MKNAACAELPRIETAHYLTVNVQYQVGGTLNLRTHWQQLVTQTALRLQQGDKLSDVPKFLLRSSLRCVCTVHFRSVAAIKHDNQNQQQQQHCEPHMAAPSIASYINTSICGATLCY